MFTGLVQGIGIVRRSQMIGLDLKLAIYTDSFDENVINVGDSVAVDGVCLTVVDKGSGCLWFDVSRETLSRTLLGSKVQMDRVNLELALLPTTRIGGHFVTGHVDGIGRLESREHMGVSYRLIFRVSSTLSRFIAEKGSICIDGVSLTVNAVGADTFEVNIVPHTNDVTTMEDYKVGRKVHLEVDVVARYIDRLISCRSEASRKRAAASVEAEASDEITQDFLSKQGFFAPDLGE